MGIDEFKSYLILLLSFKVRISEFNSVTLLYSDIYTCTLTIYKYSPVPIEVCINNNITHLFKSCDEALEFILTSLKICNI